MNTTFEQNKLKAYLGEDLCQLFKANNFIVAGGTVTSIFTNSEINDIDVYARCEEDVLSFIEDTWQNGSYVVSHTKKATQLLFGEKHVQLIHFKYYENTEEIFNSFDFTVCMGAYDFKDNKFYLHNDFLKHNSQRLLRFNSNTDYPIVSALRVQKYEGKGFNISKAEYLRIVMSCMTLEINTYDELKDHLGGLYGVNLDKLFEDVKDEDFDMVVAIDKIADITLSDDYFVIPARVEFDSMDDLLDSISKKPNTYVEFKDKLYRIRANGDIEKAKEKSENHAMIDIKDLYPDAKLYKFVKKNDDGTYQSFYEDTFKYEVGKMVEASTEKRSTHYDLDGKIYLNPKEKISASNYYKHKGGVLLEIAFTHADLIDINSLPKVTISKGYVLREVPEVEWKEWVKVKDDKTPRGINNPFLF